MVHLILYSKPGCHLCEGLQAKLEQIQTPLLHLEVRDITGCEAWFEAYQYDIPVLSYLKSSPAGGMEEVRLPRPSPRASVEQLAKFLQKQF